MTQRQIDLLNYLREIYKITPNRWVSQKEIADNVGGYTYIDRPNDRCSTIREDKIAINNSKDVNEIIVMKNYTYKIASEEEYKKERIAHIRRLKRQVEQVKDMDFKARRNNTMNLLPDNEDEIWFRTFYERN